MRQPWQVRHRKLLDCRARTPIGGRSGVGAAAGVYKFSISPALGPSGAGFMRRRFRSSPPSKSWLDGEARQGERFAQSLRRSASAETVALVAAAEVVVFEEPVEVSLNLRRAGSGSSARRSRWSAAFGRGSYCARGPRATRKDDAESRRTAAVKKSATGVAIGPLELESASEERIGAEETGGVGELQASSDSSLAVESFRGSARGKRSLQSLLTE